MAHDDMIEHFNFHQLAGANEVAGHFNVRLGRLWLARRVIVHEHNGCRTGDNGRSERFPGRNEQGIQSPDGYKLMPFDPATGVQQENDEAFAFRVEIGVRLHVEPPVFGRTIRGIAEGQTLWQGTFPERNDLVFLGDSGHRSVIHRYFRGRRHLVMGAGVAPGTDGGHSARVLPAFPPGVPMEAEFPELVADRLDRRDIELKPDPFADNLGLLEHFRHFPPQPLKQAEGGKRTCIR